MLHLFTFCVDIQKIPKSDLVRCLNFLILGLDKHVQEYKLTVYSNFLNSHENPSVQIRQYYDKQTNRMYANKWLNLSFNKINIWKDLYDEQKIEYTWLDLDTFVCYDISYYNNLSNLFIKNQGRCQIKNVLFHNNNQITVPRHEYIQGNVWKLNLELYHQLFQTLDIIKRQRLQPRYDLQDIFNYHQRLHPNSLTVLDESINGLGVWDPKTKTHATLLGLKNIYVKDGIYYTKLIENKPIHILSFTFMTLRKLWNTPQFKTLFLN